MTAVLFDFSGTLCRTESTESWLRATLAAAGTRMESLNSSQRQPR